MVHAAARVTAHPTAAGRDGDEPIFVFETNLAGNHDLEAGLLAVSSFGAVQGRGSGPQGHSYAVPTADADGVPFPREMLAHYMRGFIKYAAAHPALKFRVPALGFGNPYLSQSDLAGMFKSAPKNLLLPGRWLELLSKLAVVRVVVLDTATQLPRPEAQKALNDYFALNAALWNAQGIEIVSIGPARSIVANDHYARRHRYGHRIISADVRRYGENAPLARDEFALWYATRLLVVSTAEQTAPPHLFRTIQSAVRAGLPVEELLVSE